MWYVRNVRLSRWLCSVLLALSACGPNVAVESGSESSSGPHGDPFPGSGAPNPSTTGPSTATGTPGSGVTTSAEVSTGNFTGGAVESGNPDSAGFIADPDFGIDRQFCELFDPWCSRGHQCRPWANDGGDDWNSLRCVPTVSNPVAVGDVCVVDGDRSSGIDNCSPSAMCFDVVGDAQEGRCVAYCEGTPAAPVCEDPDTTCVIGNEDSISVCLPTCQPLLEDCPTGLTCVGDFDNTDPGSFCLGPETPYTTAGGVRLSACGMGRVAVAPQHIDSCEGDAPCCTQWCDLSLPDTCGEGLTCRPFYEEGQVLGMHDEGLCLSPE